MSTSGDYNQITVSNGSLQFQNATLDVSQEAVKQSGLKSGISKPHPHDVLAGRGNSINSHPGNQYFRSLVRHLKNEYVITPKRGKPLFAKLIVKHIQALQPLGRFLKKNKGNLWEDIGQKQAHNKTRRVLMFDADKILDSINKGTRKVTTVSTPTFLHIICQEHQEHQGATGDIFDWLCHQFDDLPVHQACYKFGNDEFTTLSFVSTVIQENKQTMMTTDRMGMTCLHILSCNPRATVEVMQLLVTEEPLLLGRIDDFGNTPLQLFLKCRRLLGVDLGIMPSLQDLLEEGIAGEDLAILFTLNGNREIDLSSPDEETGLLPFMSAAASPACGLDAVFTFAMNSSLEMISN